MLLAFIFQLKRSGHFPHAAMRSPFAHQTHFLCSSPSSRGRVKEIRFGGQRHHPFLLRFIPHHFGSRKSIIPGYPVRAAVFVQVFSFIMAILCLWVCSLFSALFFARRIVIGKMPSKLCFLCLSWRYYFIYHCAARKNTSQRIGARQWAGLSTASGWLRHGPSACGVSLGDLLIILVKKMVCGRCCQQSVRIIHPVGRWRKCICGRCGSL